jgi:hypothetical protein
VLRLLNTRQHKLEDTCTPTGTGKDMTHYRRTVNTFLSDDTKFGVLSDQLLSSAPTMMRLLLEGDQQAYLHWPDQLYIDVGSKRAAPTPQLDSLQDFVVRSRPLDRQFHDEWSTIIDFSALLWRCHLPPDKFLAALGSHLQGQVVHLQHFAMDISCMDDYPPFSFYKLHRSVALVLRGCTKLRSLHLHWLGLLGTEDTTETEDFGKPLELPDLDVCKSLEILSLHEKWSCNENSLVSWLQQCPRITQLALNISELHPHQGVWQYTRISVSSSYMHCIRFCMIIGN